MRSDPSPQPQLLLRDHQEAGEQQLLAVCVRDPGQGGYQWWWVVRTVVSFTPCFLTASKTCKNIGGELNLPWKELAAPLVSPGHEE